MQNGQEHVKWVFSTAALRDFGLESSAPEFYKSIVDIGVSIDPPSNYIHPSRTYKQKRSLHPCLEKAIHDTTWYSNKRKHVDMKGLDS